MALKAKDYSPALQQGALIESANIEGNAITGAKLSTGKGFFTVAANTNGTTAVSVFGASGIPTAATITGVYLVSQDTTGGNITVENPENTVVCTIAKGTAANAMVGATTLSDAVVAAGTNVVVESSSAGNARVFITFEVA